MVDGEKLSKDARRNSDFNDFDEILDNKMTNSLTRPRNCQSHLKDESYLHNSEANFRLFNIFHPRDPVVCLIVKPVLKVVPQY